MGFSTSIPDLRQLYVALLLLAALVSIGGDPDPQEPLCSGDDTCPGARFKMSPSLDILLPRDGEQVLGSDLEGEERVVRLSIDGGEVELKTRELARP
ncbi:hypothetical protein T484DRAFT_1845413 [Baffinella frigidus]|nr:hypothetical protein T484DRAFT_1845413 [Cryptophyta sp. CCMP2293]